MLTVGHDHGITKVVDLARRCMEKGVICLQALIDDGKLEVLQEMYRSWPFFSVTMDMIEMVFAKVALPTSLTLPLSKSKGVCRAL